MDAIYCAQFDDLRERGEMADGDFDEYDPTPYGGGYDIFTAFGRPLPPSEEICYPISSSGGGGGFDYERPSYSSGSIPSSYGGSEAEGDRYGRKPIPQPAYDFRPQQEEHYGGGTGGFGSDGKGDYGTSEDYGSGYGKKAQWQQQQEQGYGSGYGGGRPHREEEGGQGYRYGNEYQIGGGEYRSGGDGQGYGYEGKPSYQRPSYGGRDEEETGRYQRPSYGRNDEETESYQRPSYGRNDEEETGRYQRPSYGRNDEEETGRYQRPSYGRNDEEETGRYQTSYGMNDVEEAGGYQRPSRYDAGEGEGYDRSTYGNTSGDAERKQRHHKPHHRRYDGDDE